MSSKIREATALHLVQGMKHEQSIPAGHHSLEGYEAVFTFPKGAAVDRDEGTAGDGFDTGKPPVPTVPPAAVLLFVNRFHHLLLIRGDAPRRLAWPASKSPRGWGMARSSCWRTDRPFTMKHRPAGGLRMSGQRNDWLRFCAADGKFDNFVREVDSVMKSHGMEPHDLCHAAALIAQGETPDEDGDFSP